VCYNKRLLTWPKGIAELASIFSKAVNWVVEIEGVCIIKTHANSCLLVVVNTISDYLLPRCMHCFAGFTGLLFGCGLWQC
jgi:hypothetical protein